MMKPLNIMRQVFRYRIIALCVACILIAPLTAGQALAQTTGDVPLGTCTTSSDYDISYPDPTTGGIFTEINNYITYDLSSLSKSMFKTLLSQSNVKGAIQAAATLYIAIYGIVFMFGMAQITVFDFSQRLVKVAIIYALLSSNAWIYFSQIFGGDYDGNGNPTGFFEGGVTEIINKVSSVLVGGLSDTQNGPLWVMDYAIAMVVSPKMAATLIAAFTTGPYALGIGLILVMSLASFLKSLMTAMWVYVMALVMRMFLYALAPFFIPCILFSRTKHLFDGWLSQLVNACLQPIFLFTFFSFFAVLIEACLDQLFSTPVCWTAVKDAVKGAPFEGQFWRFAVWDCVTGNWVPFDGVWGFEGPQDTGCGGQPVHPIGIVLPLTLWIISDLASRFNVVIIQIAHDISQTTTDFGRGIEKLADWASGGAAKDEGGSRNQAGAQAEGGRAQPGGPVAPPPPRAETPREAPKSAIDKIRHGIAGLQTKRRQ